MIVLLARLWLLYKQSSTLLSFSIFDLSFCLSLNFWRPCIRRTCILLFRIQSQQSYKWPLRSFTFASWKGQWIYCKKTWYCMAWYNVDCQVFLAYLTLLRPIGPDIRAPSFARSLGGTSRICSISFLTFLSLLSAFRLTFEGLACDLNTFFCWWKGLL